MIQKVLTKELLFATMGTLLILGIFKRYKFVTYQPPAEKMTNVSCHSGDDYNV